MLRRVLQHVILLSYMSMVEIDSLALSTAMGYFMPAMVTWCLQKCRSIHIEIHYVRLVALVLQAALHRTMRLRQSDAPELLRSQKRVPDG